MVLRPPAALRRLSASVADSLVATSGARGASGSVGGGAGASGDPPHIIKFSYFSLRNNSTQSANVYRYSSESILLKGL